jgi:hypothetical protein
MFEGRNLAEWLLAGAGYWKCLDNGAYLGCLERVKVESLE